MRTEDRRAFRVFYFALAFFVAGLVWVTPQFFLHDTRVETRTLSTVELPQSYDEAEEKLGPGQPVNPEEIGAAGMTSCAIWSAGQAVQLLACK